MPVLETRRIWMLHVILQSMRTNAVGERGGGTDSISLSLHMSLSPWADSAVCRPTFFSTRFKTDMEEKVHF